MAGQSDESSRKRISWSVRTSTILLSMVCVFSGATIGALSMRAVHERASPMRDEPQTPPADQPPPGRPENRIPRIVRPHLVSIYAKTEFHNRIWRNETVELSGAGFLIEPGHGMEGAWILTSPEVIGLDLMVSGGKEGPPRLASYEIGLAVEPPYRLSEINRLLVHRTRPAVLLVAESVGGRLGGLSPASEAMPLGESLYAAYQPDGLPVKITRGVVTAVNEERGEFRFAAAIDPGTSGGPLVVFENGSLRVVGIIPATAAGGEMVHATSNIDTLLDFSEYEEIDVGDVEDVRRVVEKVWFGD